MWRPVLIAASSLSLMACGMVKDPNYHSSGKSPERAFPVKVAASDKRTFVFSPRDMAWAAYDKQGFRVKTGPAAGGSYECPEDGSDCRTVIGQFKVQRKGDASCTSSKYPLGEGGAPMAYCMHFHKGYAIHGAAGIPNAHHSHGCIHLMREDARWLNQEFLNVGSKVIVGPY